MPDREVSLQRLLEVWNGTANLDDLDELVTPNYLGHIGSRDRDLRQLKEDIVAYRHRVDSVRFEMLHRFSEGEYVETRLVARGDESRDGVAALWHGPEHQPLGKRSACGRVGGVGTA